MIYFISFVVIGVYCLLNMFLAIVLQNFEADHRNRLEAKIKKQRALEAQKLLNNVTEDEMDSPKGSNQITSASTMATFHKKLSMTLSNKFEWKFFCSCRKKVTKVIA